MGGERAELHRVALAEVAVVVDDANRPAAPLEQPLGRPVDRAVRDDDDLELARQPPCDRLADVLDVPDDLVAAVVDGNDDRQQRLRRPAFIHRIDCTRVSERAG